MGFALELEITGDNTSLVASLRETKAEYASTTREAVRGTDLMAQAAERATKSVADLGKRAAGMSSGFRTAADAAAQSSSAQAAAVDRSRAIMDDYANAMESAENHVRAYAEAMDDAAEIQARSAARAAQAQEGMQGRIARSFEALRNKVRVVTGDMVSSWRAAVDKMGSERYEAAMKRMRDASSDLQQHSVRAFKAVGVALTALATTAFIVGGNFDQAMARVGSTVGATPAQLSAMATEAKKWGETTTFGATRVAEAMLVAGDSIGNAAETIAAIGPIVQLAGARKIELAEAADLVTQAMDAFNLSGAEAGRVANVLAASAGKVDMNSVRAGLSAVAAAAGNVGLSIEQTVAMLAILDQGGQKATKSAAGLQGIFSSLLSPSDELKKLMGGLTVESNGLMAVMQQLASQGAPALAQAFDARQLQVIITLAKAGPAAFDEMTRSLTGTTSAAEMFARNQQNVQAQFLILKNMITGVMIAAFETLADVSLSSISDMQAAVQRYKARVVEIVATARDWVIAHKGQIAAVAELVLKIGPLVIILGLLLKSANLVITAAKTGQAAWLLWRAAFALAVPAINAVSVAMGGAAVASAAMAGPIGIAVLAITGLVLAMRGLRRESDLMAAGIPQSIGGIADEMQAAEMRATKMRDTMVREWGSVAVAPVGFQTQLREVEARIAQLRTAHDTMTTASVVNFERMKAAAVAGMPTLAEFARMATAPKAPSAPSGGEPQAAAERVSGGGAANSAALAGMVGANLAAFAQIEDGWRATQIRMANLAPAYTAESLLAREALINNAYEREVATAEGSAARIAEMQIQRDAELAATRMAYQDAVYQHWMETHGLMALAIGGLSAAYDTAVELIIRAETNLQKIRESLWMSFKRSFITGAAQMFKAYIGEQLKAAIIGQAINEKVNAQEKFTQAKLGAVKAFQAFAGIPIIGPALGAAAAAAAFAFLIAFHSGGLVGRLGQPQNGNERIARLEVGEYVMRRQAVEQMGTRTLDYVNRTGQMPQGPGSSPTFHFHIYGSSETTRDMMDWIDDVIVPQLEDRFKNGRFRLSPA